MASLIETRRNILMSSPHLTSASGSLATFNTDLSAPLKDMKVHFYPMQASGTPSPDNVLPISGWDGVNVGQCKKNVCGGERLIDALLLQSYTKQSDAEGDYVEFTKRNSSAYEDIYSSGLIKENTAYTIILRTDLSASSSVFAIFYTDGTVRNISPSTGLSTSRFVTDSTKTFKGIRTVMRAVTTKLYFNESGIFEGNISADEFEPYQGTAIPITFPQTIYGGYVDLVRGEVVETYGKIELTGDENLGLNPWNRNGVYWQVRETSYDTAKIPFMTGQSYGNILPYYNHGYYPRTDGSFGIVGAGTIPNYTYLTLYNSNWGTTVEEYKSALKELYDNGTPLTIVAPLKTAYIQHYPLTPQTIKALKGINNIFSDANGNVEVTYWTH